MLRVGAAESAVVDVENRLVRDAPADVVGVAALAVVNRPLRRARGVRFQPFEQRNLAVVLFHQDVAQPMRDGQRPQRADRIDEQRVRPVEGIDEAAAGDVRPAPRLDRAAELQGQLVEVAVPRHSSSIRPSFISRNRLP